ncbi:unnamed protein product [Trifolium pratense]|uniref:Uncharacterized protein n=1 Tax=Trifolium pratense TaxID=57577 RepID=A0ACB0KG02_TRIPR|nr:unnamed protein product [Trifolium pratense]
MDRGDIYKSSSSLRGNSSTFFSRSSRREEDDDEEALTWAAIERLPTYNRLKKGLLATSHGVSNEIIDVTKLGLQERQKLLNRLINVAEEDNEMFLLKLKERIDRVGIDIPTIEVRYEHLTVEAEAYVGSRALPTFTNFTIGAVEGLLTLLHILSRKKKHVTILKDVSGIVKPRRMTLLLGPPSSGKTTLLLALTGKLDKTLKESGRVTYNGYGMDEFVPQRTAAYIGQHDVHIGEMTVRETLAFSARCQGVGSRYDLLSELCRREKEAKIIPDPDIDVYMKAASTEGQEASLLTDYMLKMLGLDKCADTMVGDEMRRGISGGQRKRLTTGEMLVGPSKVLFMDEISTGLDSSTAFQIVKSLGQYVHILNGTALISLLQPAPETYELFDDIILLSDGEIVYQGPREHVLDFFESVGFKCPERKGVADFLQEITPSSNMTLGLQVLKSRGFFTHARSNAVADSRHGKKRGMVLPFEPYSITFDEIVYSVDMPQEMKDQAVMEDRLVLLKGVSGAFRPGVLTALMGVSGAVSGYPKKQETFARISGYCEQNDIHSPQFTVYESLLYSAWLRLPAEVDSNTRKMFIEEVMELVELNPLRNTIVGLPGVSGLSTEQRKRLTIAVELVANPSIIFMDEPTSGLDARAAAIVMRTVRNTVDTGRTVVCTIHQPSIDIFEAFDELLLMKSGGQEIYVGPLGRYSNQLIKYFESIEGVSKIKDGCNPATWMLEVTSPSQELALGVDFHEIYKNSELYRRNKQLIAELGKPAPGSNDLHFPTQYSQSFLVQCMACLWKQRWSYWRNPPYTAVRFYFATFIALMFGTMFWDLGRKYSKGLDLANAMGSMYTAVFFIGVQNSASVQPVVSVERTVFYREKAAGMYSALPYALAQVVIELPYIFVQALSYGVIVYAMIGFEWTIQKFFWYMFFMYFTFCYFTFYGMMTMAAAPDHHIAAVLASAFYGLWNLFSGFLIPRTRMPVWWRWFYWANPVAWSLYGLFASQFGNITNILEMENVSVQEYIRNYYGIKHEFVGVSAAVVSGIAILFAFIFAVSIKVFNFQHR